MRSHRASFIRAPVRIPTARMPTRPPPASQHTSQFNTTRPSRSHKPCTRTTRSHPQGLGFSCCSDAFGAEGVGASHHTPLLRDIPDENNAQCETRPRPRPWRGPKFLGLPVSHATTNAPACETGSPRNLGDRKGRVVPPLSSQAPSDRARTARTAHSAACFLSPVVQPAGYPRTTS